MYIHPYSKLGEVSKGLYINGCEVHWGYKSSVQFNTVKCKYIIQYHFGQTIHQFNIYTRPIWKIIRMKFIHIRSIV